jgi:hypothetical protein
MKKLNLLIVVALLASALLMAATPAKLVRLEVINQTDAPVYIKLTGELTDAFYYLTIPAEETMTFTVLTDNYKRETWACDYKSSGRLVMTGNVRLNFVPCNTMPLRRVWAQDCDQYGENCVPLYVEGKNGVLVPWIVKVVNKGEPTMEKVSYFKYYTGTFWTWDCGLWLVAQKTFKTPTGCFFRYRY